jgi:hypothetical protein
VVYAYSGTTELVPRVLNGGVTIQGGTTARGTVGALSSIGARGGVGALGALLLREVLAPSPASVLVVVLLLGEVWAPLVVSTCGVVSVPSAGAPVTSPLPPPPPRLSSRP